jgi:hypothetical protein
MNVLPMLKLLNTMKTFTPLTVFPINQQICLHGARSGFEPELPVHIITLLSEMPVTYTSTCRIFMRSENASTQLCVYSYGKIIRELCETFSQASLA